MSLQLYESSCCRKRQLAFQNEPHRLTCNCGGTWSKVFSNVFVAHTTVTLGSVPLLDSYQSAEELNQLLNIEAQREADMKALNKARIKG